MARAVTQGVYGTGTVNLGDLDPESGPVTEQITWTNTTGQDVGLDLELDVTDQSGDAPAPGALTLGADSVTVPAGATAAVPLTVDPARLDHGRYAGQLVATGGDVTAHTTVGVVKSAPTHEVTLRAVGFDGESITATPVIFVGEDPRVDTLVHVWKDTTKTVELGEGDYFMSALVTPDVYDEDSAVALIDPDFEVTEDRALVLDARNAVRVEIDTPKPAVLRGNLGYTSYRAARGRTFYHSVMEFDSTTSIWVTPTERAKGGIFEFTSRWQLAEPLLSARPPAPTNCASGRGTSAPPPRSSTPSAWRWCRSARACPRTTRASTSPARSPWSSPRTRAARTSTRPSPPAPP